MPDMDPSLTHGLPDTNGNVFEQVDSNLEHIFQNAISNPGRFPIFQMMRMALLRLVEQVSIWYETSSSVILWNKLVSDVQILISDILE